MADEHTKNEAPKPVGKPPYAASDFESDVDPALDDFNEGLELADLHVVGQAGLALVQQGQLRLVAAQGDGRGSRGGRREGDRREGVQHLGVEVIAPPLLQHPHGLFEAQRLLVRATRGQRVEDIGNGEDTRLHRNILAL